MQISFKPLLGMALVASLVASAGAQAGPRRNNFVAGALAGAAVGALAGSAFAAGPPPPVYVYGAPPAWYPDPPLRPRFEIDHDWDDHDDDWDD
ncbi:hypothetical protein [Bosea sp. TND4EK4]|uniref:hypothetical protein n=2 Tax=unclassified Bosea (in: a-proteobacteria) TaxID=2653178 RepID=UPI0009551DF2|nr:hypothetical protein [Bosea sp. TND4EK4]TAJ34917.1 MAG: hypothetical protein EPO59_00170 [Bosea sp. (in: a-proteobacteria)]SIR50699.1 hypothetical protein SAMN05880592_1268 [Bosea sp. TND4EK4]